MSLSSGYPVVLTQYVNLEYGDDEDPYYVQKEFILPMPLISEKIGLIIPELEPYVIRIYSGHYDLRDGKFYAEINGQWIQEWNGNKYDHPMSQLKLWQYLHKLKVFNWRVVRRVTNKKAIFDKDEPEYHWIEVGIEELEEFLNDQGKS